MRRILLGAVAALSLLAFMASPVFANGTSPAPSSFGASQLFREALNSDFPGRCANGAPNNGTQNGFVAVARQDSAPFVYVFVALRAATPNTTYTVDRSCVGPIGTLHTDSSGNARGVFTVPSPPGDNRFVFDVLNPAQFNPFFSTGLITLRSGGSEE
jgi:hypothetical protein